MTLYEIKGDILNFIERFESGEIPEEAFADTLESMQYEFNYKVDNVACYIKTLMADAKAIKEEMNGLSERVKSKQTRVDNMKKYLYDCMKALDKKKIETSRNLLTIRTNPESVQITDEEKFIEWAAANHDELLNYVKPTPNKTAIKSCIKKNPNDEVKFCNLVKGERIDLK